MDIIELTRELISRANPEDPGDTRTIASFVTEYLDKGRGDVRQVEQGKHVSVVARKGSAQPTLALNGHLDVVGVTPGDWTSAPFEPDARGGYLYGRGSYDMKGGLAGLIRAFEQYEPDGIGLVLMAVADEESGGLHGTRSLLDDGVVRPDACIIGEPTGPDTSVVGRKGRMQIELTTHGEAAHGSEYPHRGDSAIEALANALTTTAPRLRMFAIDDAGWDEGVLQNTTGHDHHNEDGHDPETLKKLMHDVTVNVGLIDGGTAPNVVADEAQATLDIRYPPGADKDEIIDLLQRRLTDNNGITMNIERDKPPALLDRDEDIAQAVRACGVESVYSYASDDMAHFQAHDIPAIAYGPYRGADLHGVDEHVKMDDLRTLPDQYRDAMNQYQLRVQAAE